MRTRAHLVRAAQKVFERDGYLDARVADIAAAAGVAHGSFYTYFDSKEDVFRELAEAVVKEVYAALDTPEEGDPQDRIRATNRRYIELYERHALVLGLIEQVGNLGEFHGLRRALRGRLVDRVEHVIRGLRADGEAGPEPLDPHLVASALVGMVDSFAYSWFVLKEPFDREPALANLDAIWLRTLGIATP
jgi:AcrR family transcriptional regulator